MYPGDGLSGPNLHALISDHYTQLNPFSSHHYLSCVDGRQDHMSLGTFGGSLGELILALHSFHTLYPLKEISANDFLISLTKSGHVIYYHSDDTSHGRLMSELYRSGFIDIDLDNPPLHLRAALIPFLLDPYHIGCGHVKQLLTNNNYNADKALVHQVIEAYWYLHWSELSNFTVFEVLSAEHAEMAVSIVKNVKNLTIAFPFRAEGKGSSFVLHKDVVNVLRGDLAQLLAQFTSTDATTLLNVIKGFGAVWQGLTLAKLAHNLPIYEITFIPELFYIESVVIGVCFSCLYFAILFVFREKSSGLIQKKKVSKYHGDTLLINV
ncbi:hypothetical protein RCL1_005501 [Eukaryota sp. TZLM3-RCL]